MQLQLFEPGAAVEQTKSRRDERNGNRVKPMDNALIARVLVMESGRFLEWWGTSRTAQQRARFYWQDEVAAVAAVWLHYMTPWVEFGALDEEARKTTEPPPVPCQKNGRRMFVDIGACLNFLHDAACSPTMRARYEAILDDLPPFPTV